MVQNELKTETHFFRNVNLRTFLSSCPFLTLSCIVIAHQSIRDLPQPITENRKFYFTFPVFHQQCYKSSLKSFHSLQLLPRYRFKFILLTLHSDCSARVFLLPRGHFAQMEPLLIVTLGRGAPGI